MYRHISIVTHYRGTGDFYEFIKSSDFKFYRRPCRVGHKCPGDLVPDRNVPLKPEADLNRTGKV